MPRSISSKCRECSKLDTQAAKLKECWDSSLCPDRRYNYRNREKRNRDRRNQQQSSKPTPIIIEPRIIDSPEIIAVAPVVIYWRVHKEAEVHAIGAVLQVGSQTILEAAPRHCLGSTAEDIYDWLRVVLKNFEQEYGKPVGKFVRGGIEYHPSLCPICHQSECAGN